jgi:sec-independent protein translocase protein TatA
MSNIKGWELVIILALLLLLFGSKRLPDAARGLGRSLRIFKAEIKDLDKDDEPPAEPAPRREIQGSVESTSEPAPGVTNVRPADERDTTER